VSALALSLGLVTSSAWAAPVRGTGEATAAETKKPSPAEVRARALRRARTAALQTALSQVGGPVDPEARKAVMGAWEVWTGAYRILSESGGADGVRVEVEAEIDVVRLTKRVQRADESGGKPAFVMGSIRAGATCGETQAVSEVVRAELSGQGAVTLEPPPEGKGKGKAKLVALDVTLECGALGPVRHTYLHAAQVHVVAQANGQTVAEQRVPAFAITPVEAMAGGVSTALLDVGEQLAQHRKGFLRLRVRSPLPSARIRRLEAAMRNSVLGVSEVEVAGLERGVVELRVRGSLDAKTLAQRLAELPLPGFSLSVVDVDPPDALTVALE